MWCADIEKWVADLAVEGLLFVKVSTKLDIHSFLTGSAAGPLAWSEIDPAHRAFDARGPTKSNFQRPDRAGQRCKCRLVCEWVCTVTSVSVRIEKRANCAKNNKPKSGGLFFVNARPFPEHSSSRATFSEGRAWLEATCPLANPDNAVKLQIFVRYPFSYFWLETGSYELIFVLSRALKQNYIEIRWPQDKNKFSSGIKFRTVFKSTKVRN